MITCIKLFSICVAVFSFLNCTHTRSLRAPKEQSKEPLLVQQYIRGNRHIPTEMLSTQLFVHPSKKLFGLYIWTWIYNFGKRRFNPEKIKRRIDQLLLKQQDLLSMPYKKSKLGRITQKLTEQKYLLKHGNFWMRLGDPPVMYQDSQQVRTEERLLHYLHTRGYFQAKVFSKAYPIGPNFYTVYSIEEDIHFRIHDVSLRCEDSALRKHFENALKDSLLVPNKYYEENLLVAERDRLYDYISNVGYFDFNKRLIHLNVDRISIPGKTIIEIFISPGDDDSQYRLFDITSIHWDIMKSVGSAITPSDLHQNNVILNDSLGFFRTPEVLNMLPIKPPQLYRKKDILATQNCLESMRLFERIHIAQHIIGPGQLKTHIYTTPFPCYQLTQEYGLQHRQSGWRPFVEFKLISRNRFQCLETLGITVNSNIKNLVYTKNCGLSGAPRVGIKSTLTLPKWLWKRRVSELSSETNLELEYKLFYKERMRYNVRGSLSTHWINSNQGEHTFTPFRIELFNPSDPEAPTWISLFTWRYKNGQRNASLAVRSPSKVFGLFIEHGGGIQSVLHGLNILNQPSCYTYLKFQSYYSGYYPIGTSTALAYRLLTGTIWPYRDYKNLPKGRAYNAGGPNGIRAFKPGELGANRKESLLLGNLELRHHLFGVFETAVFVDVGNTWSITSNYPSRGLAIGVGTGLRINLYVMILALDAGLQIYNPDHPQNLGKLPLKDLINWHLTLGYPF